MAATTPKRDGIKTETIAVTCYFLHDEHKRLRQLALDLDLTVQELILRGVDLIFGQHGQSPVKRYSGARAPRGERKR